MELLNSLRGISQRAVIFLLVGLALRGALIVAHQRPPISDERDYHQLAVSLSTTGTYGVNGTPTAYRPFAYPAFIGFVYILAGEYPLVVKILQAIADLLIALLLFLLLKEAPEASRIAALALWCFFLPAALYTNFLLTETVFTFVLVVFCFVLVRSKLEKPSIALMLGVVLGLLVLMKPGMLLLVVLLPIVLYFGWIPLKRYKFIVVGTLLVLTPWLIRNYYVLGKPTIATNGGINLLIGNNPNSTGAYAMSYPEDVLQGAANEIDADETAYRYALNYILDNPARFILNGFKKIAHLFSSESGLLVWSFHDQPEDFSERFAAKYASVPFLYTILVNATYVFVLLVGILGLFTAQKNLLWWFVIVLVACWLATHFVFFGGSRYHFPLMPFFALYAGTVIPHFLYAIRRLTTMQKAAYGTITLGLLTVWIAEVATIANALSPS
ncbi:MAG TPA: hypothetical protein VII11_05230 [Bacteroidota bacterium]